MPEEEWTAVDRYLEEKVVRQDPLLERTLEASAAAGLPAIQVSPSQGKLLYLLARTREAHRILEIGTLGGYSTIWLARALPSEGRLLSLELDPHHAEVARANIAAAGLSKIVEIRVGPALTTLERIQAEGTPPFDLIFIDADKPAYPEYLVRAKKLGRRGTMIVADNVVRRGAVADPMNPDPNVRGVRAFLDRLSADRTLDATVIQTVGSKGHDGLAIALMTTDP